MENAELAAELLAEEGHAVIDILRAAGVECDSVEPVRWARAAADRLAAVEGLRATAEAERDAARTAIRVMRSHLRSPGRPWERG